MNNDSNVNSGPETSNIDQFLRHSWKKDEFQRQADAVKQAISDALKEDPKDKRILHQLSARAKDGDSLRKKLLDNKASYKSVDDIITSGEIWDLAGVRVLVYFPDDIPGALQKVLAKFTNLASKPFVRGNKRTHKRLPEKKWDDISKEPEDSALSRIGKELSGPWIEESVEQVVRHWKHYGYMAVHLTVLVDGDPKQAREQGKEETEEPGEETKEKREEKKRYRQEWTRRVEVQITTVVMHAWSEVEHDLIYKNPWNLPPNTEIDRMLDAINGLSITSEILLRQLRQTIDAISTRDNRPFHNDSELERALEEWYLLESSAVDRTTTRQDSLSTLTLRRTLTARPWNITTRKGLRPLLRRHEAVILRRTGDGPIDLSFNLLCALNNIDVKFGHFEPGVGFVERRDNSEADPKNSKNMEVITFSMEEDPQ